MFWLGKSVCQAALMRMKDFLETKLAFSILPFTIPGFRCSWRNIQLNCLLHYSNFLFVWKGRTLNGTTLLIHLSKVKKNHSGWFVLYMLYFIRETFCYGYDIGTTLRVVKWHYVVNTLYINKTGMWTKYNNFGTVTLSLLPDFQFKVRCLSYL